MRAPGVSAAQVARRYAVNADLIFKWLRRARYAPPGVEAETAVSAGSSGEPALPGRFLPVEPVGAVGLSDAATGPCTGTAETDITSSAAGVIEVDLSIGHRLRIIGPSDPDALACFLRGLSA